MPNKLLGQHFLKNPHAAQEIVRAVAPSRGETIFEIGPGHGELTAPLAAACKDAGARLIVIEKDPTLARALEEKANSLGIKVVVGDALKLLPAQAAALGNGPFKIVGNIPYYISGHLLRVLSELPQKPVCCVLMVQKEVAERTTAAPPRMNRLAASVQFWADPKIVMRIPRAEFHPMPQVDSAVVALETKSSSGISAVTPEKYYKAVRALFAQPRKTILNNIAAQQKDEGKDEIAARIQKIGIDPAKRPQDLSIAQIITLAESFWG